MCQHAQASKAYADQSVSKPAMQSDGNPEEASAPGSLLSMFSATSAAELASESLAASSTACPSTLAAPSMSFASSAEKPATGQLHSVAVASESMTLTLSDALSMLTANSSHVDAQQLLQDIPVLQEWQRATRPSNKVRDAMTKLGSHWNVPRNVDGHKRSLSEVARDMEESMLKRARLALSCSVPKPATQSDNNQDVLVIPTMSSLSSAAKPATNQLHSVVTPTMSPLSSAAKLATNQLHSVPVASESMTLTLPDILSRLQGNSSQTDAQQLLQDIPVLQEWQRAANPSHKVRDAMVKLGSHWDVPRNAKGRKRSPSEVTKHMEESMLKRARLVLSSSVSQLATQSDNNPEEKSSAISAEKLVAESGRLPQMTLHSLAELFADRSNERRVKSLLSDVATLRAWQRDAHVSHAIRDSMTKLGSKWRVPQKARGKKRAPRDIAAELEHEFLACAERLWAMSTPFSPRRSAGKPSPGEARLDRSSRPRTDAAACTDPKNTACSSQCCSSTYKQTRQVSD